MTQSKKQLADKQGQLSLVYEVPKGAVERTALLDLENGERYPWYSDRTFPGSLDPVDRAQEKRDHEEELVQAYVWRALSCLPPEAPERLFHLLKNEYGCTLIKAQLWSADSLPHYDEIPSVTEMFRQAVAAFVEHAERLSSLVSSVFFLSYDGQPKRQAIFACRIDIADRMPKGLPPNRHGHLHDFDFWLRQHSWEQAADRGAPTYFEERPEFYRGIALLVDPNTWSATICPAPEQRLDNGVEITTLRDALTQQLRKSAECLQVIDKLRNEQSLGPSEIKMLMGAQSFRGVLGNETLLHTIFDETLRQFLEKLDHKADYPSGTAVVSTERPGGQRRDVVGLRITIADIDDYGRRLFGRADSTSDASAATMPEVGPESAPKGTGASSGNGHHQGADDAPAATPTSQRLPEDERVAVLVASITSATGELQNGDRNANALVVQEALGLLQGTAVDKRSSALTIKKAVDALLELAQVDLIDPLRNNNPCRLEVKMTSKREPGWRLADPTGKTEVQRDFPPLRAAALPTDRESVAQVISRLIAPEKERVERLRDEHRESVQRVLDAVAGMRFHDDLNAARTLADALNGYVALAGYRLEDVEKPGDPGMLTVNWKEKGKLRIRFSVSSGRSQPDHGGVVPRLKAVPKTRRSRSPNAP